MVDTIGLNTVTSMPPRQMVTNNGPISACIEDRPVFRLITNSLDLLSEIYTAAAEIIMISGIIWYKTSGLLRRVKVTTCRNEMIDEKLRN